MKSFNTNFGTRDRNRTGTLLYSRGIFSSTLIKRCSVKVPSVYQISPLGQMTDYNMVFLAFRLSAILLLCSSDFGLPAFPLPAIAVLVDTIMRIFLPSSGMGGGARTLISATFKAADCTDLS